MVEFAIIAPFVLFIFLEVIVFGLGAFTDADLFKAFYWKKDAYMECGDGQEWQTCYSSFFYIYWSLLYHYFYFQSMRFQNMSYPYPVAQPVAN